MSRTVLEVGSCPIAVLPMRLQSAMALRAAHILSAPLKRFGNADGRPSAAFSDFTLVDGFAHTVNMTPYRDPFHPAVNPQISNAPATDLARVQAMLHPLAAPATRPVARTARRLG